MDSSKYSYNVCLIISFPFIGSLCVEKLGTLTSLSDTGDPSILLPHRYCASCDFWSVTHPQTKTHYSLTIIADPPEEELLPLAPPKMDNSTISPDHLDWPCVSTEVSADERCSLWSSLSPVTHVILTPKLIQAAYALLKVSNHGYQITSPDQHVHVY